MKKDMLPIFWIIIIIILIIEMVYSIYTYFDYNKRKESGNERWKQVEERIERLEEEHGRLCSPNS
mgnify:CR=1 FL=1